MNQDHNQNRKQLKIEINFFQSKEPLNHLPFEIKLVLFNTETEHEGETQKR